MGGLFSSGRNVVQNSPLNLEEDIRDTEPCVVVCKFGFGLAVKIPSGLQLG